MFDDEADPQFFISLRSGVSKGLRRRQTRVKSIPAPHMCALPATPVHTRTSHLAGIKRDVWTSSSARRRREAAQGRPGQVRCARGAGAGRGATGAAVRRCVGCVGVGVGGVAAGSARLRLTSYCVSNRAPLLGSAAGQPFPVLLRPLAWPRGRGGSGGSGRGLARPRPR